MKRFKDLRVFLFLLASLTILISESYAQVSKPTAEPIPIQTVIADPAPTAAPAQPEYLGVCECPTKELYKLGLEDAVKLKLIAAGYIKPKAKVSIRSMHQVTLPDSIANSSVVLGLSFADGSADNQFQIYANGLSNMLFTKCSVKHTITIESAAIKDGRRVLSSSASIVDLPGVITRIKRKK